MVTFVLATYALATFFHISNISAVIGPILTKLFGPNFFGIIIFVEQNVVAQENTSYFALVTFVNISNISAVTGPNLTKYL